MPEKSLPPINLSMFKPDASERPAIINHQLMHFMARFTGRGRVRFHKDLMLGGTLPGNMAEEIDRYVFESIKRIYGLPEQTDPQEFFLQQHKQARGVMEYVGRLFPEASAAFELKDEVTYCSDRPSDFFKLVSRPPDKIDPVLAYELQRHVLFAHISGLSNARNLKIRSRSFLAGNQSLLNEQLFEGVEGAGHKVVLESVHDDETNEVIGFRENMESIPPTAHLKRIPVMVRNISGIGEVYTSPRKKDDGNVVIKSLVKAQYDSGVINIDSVQDSIGMMFCLVDSHASVERLSERIVEVFKSGPRRIVNIRRRDDVRADRGQSPRFNFHRLEIQFEGIPTSFELVVKNAREFIDGELGVGKRDERGYFDGEAHLLYEARRAGMVLPVIIPKEIYDRDPERPLDLERVVVNRMWHLAQDLRGRYRA